MQRYTFDYYYHATGMDRADTRQYTIEGADAKDALNNLLAQPEFAKDKNWLTSCLSITISARELLEMK